MDGKNVTGLGSAALPPGSPVPEFSALKTAPPSASKKPAPRASDPGPEFEVGAVTWKVVERGDPYWKIAYQFTACNRSATALNRTITVRFLDAEGFALESAFVFGLTVPAGQSRDHSDYKLVPAATAPKVTRLSASFAP